MVEREYRTVPVKGDLTRSSVNGISFKREYTVNGISHAEREFGARVWKTLKGKFVPFTNAITLVTRGRGRRGRVRSAQI